MTDEEMTTFDHQMKEARTDEERQRIRELWQPHMMRCLNSTNRRVKQIEKGMATREDVDKVFNRINELHRSPRFSEDKIGWLKEHWMHVCVALYIFQEWLGIEPKTLLSLLFN